MNILRLVQWVSRSLYSFFVYPGTHRDFHWLCSGKLVLRVGSKFFERVSNRHALFKCRCSSHGAEHVISPEEGGASSPRSFFLDIFPSLFCGLQQFHFPNFTSLVQPSCALNPLLFPWAVLRHGLSADKFGVTWVSKGVDLVSFILHRILPRYTRCAEERKKFFAFTESDNEFCSSNSSL